MIVLAMAAGAVAGFVVAPRLLFAAAGLPAARSAWLPWAAVGLWVVSWHVPNPHLEATGTFAQHFVGGGAACACLARYVSDNLGLRRVVLRFATAFAVVSMLGTVNELFELAADEWFGYSLTGDTSWDLLANTLGAMVTAGLIELVWSGPPPGDVRRSGDAVHDRAHAPAAQLEGGVEGDLHR